MDLMCVENAAKAPCRTCGEVHPMLSSNDGGNVPCDTPAAMPRRHAEECTKYGPTCDPPCGIVVRIG